MITDSKFDQFMKGVIRTQKQIYPQMINYFVSANPDQEEDIIVKGDEISTKGVENGKDGVITKILKAIKYVTEKHPEEKYVVKTGVTQYFNIPMLEKELEDLPADEPCLYGIRKGANIAYGYYIIWNRKAMELLSNCDPVFACRRNLYDDAAFTRLSLDDLKFKGLYRKKDGTNMYDNPHLINHGFMPQEMKDDWILLKQKTNLTHIRHYVEKYVILRFMEEHDPSVWRALDDDLKQFDEGFYGAILRVLEYLSNVERLEAFDYNMKLALGYLDKYSRSDLEKLIILILRVYGPHRHIGHGYLAKIAPLCYEPREIQAEMYYYNFYTPWRETNFFYLFFKD